MENIMEDGTIYIIKVNETFIKIMAEPSIIQTMDEFFSFHVPGFQYMPKFRLKIWDGKLRLLDTKTGFLYFGLLPHVKEFAKNHQYQIEFLTEEPLDLEEEYSLTEAEEFAKNLNCHANHEGKYIPIVPHDYQINAFRHAIQTNRCILLSPTASGKSLMAYLLIRKYQEIIQKKILIVVPTTSLVSQLYSDFADYSYADKWDVRSECHMIMEGKEKNSPNQIYISTWQSIYKLGPKYFEQFDMVIVDECHTAKANSLTSVMKKCTQTKYRFGMSGTLNDSKCHKLVLEGLFGLAYQVVTTKSLQEKGTISDILIRCLMLHYPTETCKLLKEASYQDEIKFLIGHEGRNKFIRNLALSLKGNTLVLFQQVKNHGKPLYDLIKTKADPNRKIFYVSGETETDDRELIRKIVETEKDAIIVASFGTFSTGINIRNLHNVIFSAPSKSRILILQSLGRGLRISEGKEKLNLFDISDVLEYKSYKNHTLRHFVKRMSIYNSEKFNYELFKIRMK